MPRPQIEVQEIDPFSRPLDPGVRYLRQMRDLLDHFLNQGRISRADG